MYIRAKKSESYSDSQKKKESEYYKQSHYTLINLFLVHHRLFNNYIITYLSSSHNLKLLYLKIEVIIKEFSLLPIFFLIKYLILF